MKAAILDKYDKQGRSLTNSKRQTDKSEFGNII